MILRREQQSSGYLTIIILHLIGAAFFSLVVARPRGKPLAINTSELKRTSTITFVLAWLVAMGLTALSWRHARNNSRTNLVGHALSYVPL